MPLHKQSMWAYFFSSLPSVILFFMVCPCFSRLLSCPGQRSSLLFAFPCKWCPNYCPCTRSDGCFTWTCPPSVTVESEVFNRTLMKLSVSMKCCNSHVSSVSPRRRRLHLRGVVQRLRLQRFPGNQWIHLGTGQLLGEADDGPRPAHRYEMCTRFFLFPSN